MEFKINYITLQPLQIRTLPSLRNKITFFLQSKHIQVHIRFSVKELLSHIYNLLDVLLTVALMSRITGILKTCVMLNGTYYHACPRLIGLAKI